MTTIRVYTPSDKEAVLHLLDLNTPIYFAPQEKADLIRYLDHELESYFVVEADQQIVGCGGYNFSGTPQHAKIAWDIFHPAYQGRSLGMALLQHRLALIRQTPGLATITVRTTQLAWTFYAKAGFELVEQSKDYWAPGFDLYRMEYPL